MANGVDEVTIEATVNEGSATFQYLDSSDTEITDADGAKTGQQVSLAEGATTIKVKVTAEDTTTTNTYTVVVTRAAANQYPPDRRQQHGDDGRGHGVHLHGGGLRLRRRGIRRRWRA